MGDKTELEKAIFHTLITEIDFTPYKDKSMIVKGCGNHPIPEAAFVNFTVKLQGVAKSILFGEACSSVPLFKPGLCIRIKKRRAGIFDLGKNSI